MALDALWFTEIHANQGSAFSLKAECLHQEQTPYQNIAIYQTDTFGKLMVIDDCIMLTSRDNFIYHEMMAHPALYSHPNPERVLIIGGGDCGTLKEVLKHQQVKSVTQVDIDERVTRLSEIHFPELCTSNADPRAELAFADGIQWLKDATAKSYDVIIIDSTDPIGPAEALFSQAFYQSCFNALDKDGIFVMQSESPLYHSDSIIKPMHDDLRNAGFLDVLTLHFPQAVYPSGWWSATLACKDLPITFAREATAEEAPVDSLYYNAAIHRAAMATPNFMLKTLMG